MKTFMMTATIVGLVINVANAGPLPEAKPDEVGFSQQGLTRLDDFFAREISFKRVPGAVIAIARDGKLVHYKAYGQLDATKGTPMPPDAIFALASMTKPMAAVAGLSLMEQGRLPVCTENLNPNIVVMKSAQDGARTYDAGSLNRTRDRRILVQ